MPIRLDQSASDSQFVSIGLNDCWFRFRANNLDLMASTSNFFSSSRLCSCSYSLFLLIYRSYCVKNLHFYIFTDLFINCRKYIEWYYLNSPYIANIWKCAQYVHLFQPNYTRETWRLCVPLVLPYIYRVIAQGMRILQCYNPNKSFYI